MANEEDIINVGDTDSYRDSDSNNVGDNSSSRNGGGGVDWAAIEKQNEENRAELLGDIDRVNQADKIVVEELKNPEQNKGSEDSQTSQTSQARKYDAAPTGRGRHKIDCNCETCCKRRKEKGIGDKDGFYTKLDSKGKPILERKNIVVENTVDTPAMIFNSIFAQYLAERDGVDLKKKEISIQQQNYLQQLRPDSSVLKPSWAAYILTFILITIPRIVNSKHVKWFVSLIKKTPKK